MKYNPVTSVLSTKRRPLDSGHEEFEMALRVEVDKSAYAEDLAAFAAERLNCIAEQVRRGSAGLRPVRPAVKAEAQAGRSEPESGFCREVTDSLLLSFFRDRWLWCTLEPEETRGGVRTCRVSASSRRDDLQAAAELSFRMPVTETVSGFFGKRKVRHSLPKLTYEYRISGSGLRDSVDDFIYRHARTPPVPPSRSEAFETGETARLSKLVRTPDGRLHVSASGLVLPESVAEQAGASGADSEPAALNRAHFTKRREQLLGKLAFDPDQTHEMVADHENSVTLRAEHRDGGLTCELRLTRDDSHLPLYLGFGLEISGSGDPVETDALIDRYWPAPVR